MRLTTSKEEETRALKNISIRNPTQQQYVNKMNNVNTNIVIAVGPSGTGKTLLAVHIGIQKFLQKQVSKIVLTRPTVSVDEDIGFLPGKIEDKMLPWLRPVFDVLLKYFAKDVIEKMLNKNVIEMCPLSLMRGRTFEDSWIICDEAQNTTPSQMKMVVTRLGKNSKLVIIGDTEQHDRGFAHNGLADITQRLQNQGETAKSKGIHIIKFAQSDVQRHTIVKYMLDMYQADDISQS
jgi:phosphate starvation-inducible PhoH-like protein